MLSCSRAVHRAAGLILSLGIAILASCTKSESRPAEAGLARDTVAAAPAAPPAPSVISLADVAGKWKIRATDVSGANPVEAELIATTDSNWSIISPNRPPIPEHVVAVAGDSIVTEAGPYESFIRKGVQVRTRAVFRLEDGKLVSTSEARYATKHGDSVSQRRSEATRVQ